MICIMEIEFEHTTYHSKNYMIERIGANGILKIQFCDEEYFNYY